MTTGPPSQWTCHISHRITQHAGDEGEEYRMVPQASPYGHAGDQTMHLPDGVYGPQPTTSQKQHLRRMPGKIPGAAYVIAIVELAERASYYGVGGLFPNFVQRPLPPGGTGTGAPPPLSQYTPGALDMGIQASTALNVLFNLLTYLTPLLGGLLADIRWGKFKTIAVGTAIAGIAHVFSVYAAIPTVIASGTAFFPFLISLILLGGSAGLIKANIAPIMAEQYLPESDYVGVDGAEIVIVDRKATIQMIMSTYYGCINVGALLAIISPFAEKHVGFWLAFLIPGIIFAGMPVLLYLVHPHLTIPRSTPSSLLTTFYNFRTALCPSNSSPDPTLENDDAEELLLDGVLDREDRGATMTTETQRKVGGEKGDIRTACKFFTYFVIYNVADGGLNALVTSLAGCMTTDGLPNDILGHANPLTIIIAIPLLNRYIYPTLVSRHMNFGPMKRVVTGFWLVGAAMVWCAILQHAVYRTSPCGYQASSCDEGSGVSPLSAWLILPAPILSGLSEALSVVSAFEIGYMMSPPSLRSVVNSLFLFTQAISSALVLVFLPVMKDPLLVWPFAITGVVAMGTGMVAERHFGWLDEKGVDIDSR